MLLSHVMVIRVSTIMPIPVFLFLPASPVFLDIYVFNALMPWRYVPEIVRHTDHGMGNPGGFNVYPRSVIDCGTVPMPMVRAIPIALVKEDIHLYVRGKIDIGPRNNHDRRRSSNNDRRRRGTNIDPDVDVDTSVPYVRIADQG